MKTLPFPWHLEEPERSTEKEEYPSESCPSPPIQCSDYKKERYHVHGPQTPGASADQIHLLKPVTDESLHGWGYIETYISSQTSDHVKPECEVGKEHQ